MDQSEKSLHHARAVAQEIFNDELPQRELTQFEGMMVGATLTGMAIGCMAADGAILPGHAEALLTQVAEVIRATADEVALQ